MADFSIDDIRAGVAAGVINEGQAASMIAIANQRLGYRQNMGAEDEPFELFKGFSEIFVTVGLGILYGGFMSVAMLVGNPVIVMVLSAAITVALAYYFTLKRRMILPSIALAIVFAGSIGGLSVFSLFDLEANTPNGYDVLATATIGAIGMLVYFWKFRVPFAMFLFGLFGAGIAFSIAGIIAPESIFASAFIGNADGIFDISRNPTMAYTMLIFGILAFLGGMSFDLRDPYRISRLSACGFWLHILAAPAIVNVVALSLLNLDGTMGYGLAAVALVIIAIVALVIDRRSFLTAGIIYIGIILAWALDTGSGDDWSIAVTLLVMGASITALGTWWVQLRSVIMRLLPDFPLKNRLPPYEDAA
ncbi:MAG: hypothetical protein COA53_04390 [Rhodobacteraceae bacterium]|nr:MAG: hypothetical protein COA53_04390 [Paracoccaceae bacterium]